MLAIRLQRLGKTKHPTYRLLISEKARDTHDKSLELLGFYNPLSKDKTLDLKTDRIKYWISKGAKASNTVNNLLINAGLIEGKKMRSVRISKKRKAKMEAKIKAEIKPEAEKTA